MRQSLRVSLANRLLCFGLLFTGVSVQTAQAEQSFPGLGRAATADEIKAWDIDVRADFKGLPAGSGSAIDGEDIWEEKCESCHGVFADSGAFFTPLVGGTTAEDMERGQVANLNSGTYPHRTMLMRLSKISTLWDYVSRAMPWNAPKSLKPDEVYAVIAYMLHLGEVVPEDFVFSNENIAQVQEMLPNRNGMKPYEPMWQVTGKPDVQGDDCMRDCSTELEIQSFLPDYARDAHGNLADQNRIIGATRGAVTDEPKTQTLTETQAIAKRIKAPNNKGATEAKAPTTSSSDSDPDPGAQELAKKSNCLACHGIENKIVGPAFVEIARRYKSDSGAMSSLADKIKNGATGTWGQIPMPPNPGVSEADADRLVKWILALPQN